MWVELTIKAAYLGLERPIDAAICVSIYIQASAVVSEILSFTSVQANVMFHASLIAESKLRSVQGLFQIWMQCLGMTYSFRLVHGVVFV